MNQVILMAHNLRSSHNVGSFLRTADGLGVSKVYLSGYTPYPPASSDARLPHIRERVGKQIQKASLGAEKHVNWRHIEKPLPVLAKLTKDGYEICALEQTKNAVVLRDYKPSPKTVIVVGSEIDGVAPELLLACPIHLTIPMRGQKDSFNVSVAAAIALQHLIGQ